jgi:ribosomal protein L7/L12
MKIYTKTSHVVDLENQHGDVATIIANDSYHANSIDIFHVMLKTYYAAYPFNGEKVRLVKFARSSLGIGLREAKLLVEDAIFNCKDA